MVVLTLATTVKTPLPPKRFLSPSRSSSASWTPVDAPLLARIDGPVVRVLATIQATDLGLYAEISAARSRGGEVVLELNEGRVLLAPPMDAGVVRSVSAVRRDLAARSLPWLELDARYRGWVIVRRRAGQAGDGAA